MIRHWVRTLCSIASVGIMFSFTFSARGAPPQSSGYPHADLWGSFEVAPPVQGVNVKQIDVFYVKWQGMTHFWFETVNHAGIRTDNTYHSQPSVSVTGPGGLEISGMVRIDSSIPAMYFRIVEDPGRPPTLTMGTSYTSLALKPLRLSAGGVFTANTALTLGTFVPPPGMHTAGGTHGAMTPVPSATHTGGKPNGTDTAGVVPDLFSNHGPQGDDKYPEPGSLTRPGSKMLAKASYTIGSPLKGLTYVAVFIDPENKVFLEAVDSRGFCVPLTDVLLRVARSSRQSSTTVTLDFEGNSGLLGGRFTVRYEETQNKDGKIEADFHQWHERTAIPVHAEFHAGESILGDRLRASQDIVYRDASVPATVFVAKGIVSSGQAPTDVLQLSLQRRLSSQGYPTFSLLAHKNGQGTAKLDIQKFRIIRTSTLGVRFEFSGEHPMLGGDFVLTFDEDGGALGKPLTRTMTLKGGTPRREVSFVFDPQKSPIPINRDVYHGRTRLHQYQVEPGKPTLLATEGPWKWAYDRGDVPFEPLVSTRPGDLAEGAHNSGTEAKITKWLKNNCAKGDCAMKIPDGTFAALREAYILRVLKNAPQELRGELEHKWLREGVNPFQDWIDANLWLQPDPDHGAPAVTVHLYLDLKQPYTDEARKYLESLQPTFSQLISHEGQFLVSHEGCLDAAMRKIIANRRTQAQGSGVYLPP